LSSGVRKSLNTTFLLLPAASLTSMTSSASSPTSVRVRSRQVGANSSSCRPAAAGSIPGSNGAARAGAGQGPLPARMAGTR
jgi:hypothetical protein